MSHSNPARPAATAVTPERRRRRMRRASAGPPARSGTRRTVPVGSRACPRRRPGHRIARPTHSSARHSTLETPGSRVSAYPAAKHAGTATAATSTRPASQSPGNGYIRTLELGLFGTSVGGPSSQHRVRPFASCVGIEPRGSAPRMGRRPLFRVDRQPEDRPAWRRTQSDPTGVTTYCG